MFENILKEDYCPRNTLLSSNINKFIYSIEFDVKGIELKNKSVVDIGCGSGIYSLYFALKRDVKVVISIDSYEGHGNPAENKKYFENVIEKYNLSNKITLLQSDVCKIIPIDKESVDIVYCSNVLHHIYEERRDIIKLKYHPEHIKQFLDNLHNICKKGAIIIVNELLRHSILELLPETLNKANIDWKSKQNPEGWKYLIEKYGFKCREIRYYVPYPLRMFNFLLANRHYSYFLRSRYRIIFEKV